VRGVEAGRGEDIDAHLRRGTDSLKTMLAGAAAINELNALRIPTFLEPLPVVKSEKGYKVVKSADRVGKDRWRGIGGSATAAAICGSSSLLRKLRCSCARDDVAILLLGGESVGDPTTFLREVAAGMSAGVNVRGALVGRNVLYPGDDDPLAVAEAVGGIVHQGWSVEQALDSKLRGRLT